MVYALCRCNMAVCNIFLWNPKFLSTFLELADSGNVVGEIDESVGVSPLVVVPRDELDEVGGERDTSLGVEDGGSGVSDEVRGDNLISSVSKNTLEGSLRSLSDGVADLLVGSGLVESDGEVDDGDVDGGDSEGHTGELSLELGNDETDGLGSSGGGGDDVGGGSSSGSPVLSSLGGSVNDELGGGHGVDGGHETLNDSVVVVDDLSEGGEAVGGARGVGDDVLVSLVVVVVDSDDVGGGALVLSGGRHDDLLGSSLQVSGALLLVEESSGGLANDVGSDGAPRNVLGVLLGEEGDLLTVDVDGVVSFLGDLERESSVNRVVLELVDEVIDVHEGVVDGGDIGGLVLEGSSEDESSDSSETVDTKSERHKREV